MPANTLGPDHLQVTSGGRWLRQTAGIFTNVNYTTGDGLKEDREELWVNNNDEIPF